MGLDECAVGNMVTGSGIWGGKTSRVGGRSSEVADGQERLQNGHWVVNFSLHNIKPLGFELTSTFEVTHIVSLSKSQ